jgi:uncharacterized protein
MNLENLKIYNMKLDDILKLFVPKNKAFFPLFERAADNLAETTAVLKRLLATEKFEQREAEIKRIKELELAGDEITHTIYDQLNQSFITPFEREDINALASSIDNVVDSINGVSQKIGFYKPVRFLPEFTVLGNILEEAAMEIKKIVYNLDNMKQFEDIKKGCIQINSLENQADEVYHKALSDLFSNETNAIELIKLKEILTNLEKAVDHAEDVSDVLKGIIIKLS